MEELAMKKFILIALTALLMMVISSCGRSDNNADDSYENGNYYETDNDEPDNSKEEPPPTITIDVPIINQVQLMPLFDSLDIAAAYFAEARAIWDKDGGALWGVPLHAPFIIACTVTRQAAANMPDPEGIFQKEGDVYIGILPDNVFIGATAIDFAGIKWGIMPWGMVLAGGHTGIMTTLHVIVHEAFHAMQPRIKAGGLSGYSSSEQEYMRTNLDARVSVMLELNALIKAARANGDERTKAISDAISIRADRHRLHPQSVEFETSVEISEGLAVFTDMMFFKELIK
jgi:hypothetical protein